MSDTEKQLREALSDVLKIVIAGHPAIDRARKVLAETAPKHAAIVAFEEWWNSEWFGVNSKTVARQSAMHFYKMGMLDTLPMVNCDIGPCGRSTKERIRDAASKVPTS